VNIADNQETGTLWSDTVSKEIFDSVDDTEKKRQEAINEVIYTERDFVRDLEYLRDVSLAGQGIQRKLTFSHGSNHCVPKI
jgi:hypothetical protein